MTPLHATYVGSVRTTHIGGLPPAYPDVGSTEYFEMKSDPLDAEAAARSVLAGTAMVVPKAVTVRSKQ